MSINNDQLPQDNQWHSIETSTQKSLSQRRSSGQDSGNIRSPVPSSISNLDNSFNFSNKNVGQIGDQIHVPQNNCNFYFINGIAYPISSANNSFIQIQNSEFENSNDLLNVNDDNVFYDQPHNNYDQLQDLQLKNQDLLIANTQYQNKLRELLKEKSEMQNEIEELKFYKDFALNRFEERKINRRHRSNDLNTFELDENVVDDPCPKNTNTSGSKFYQSHDANKSKICKFMEKVDPFLKDQLIHMKQRCRNYEIQITNYKKQKLEYEQNKSEPTRQPQMQHFPNLHQPGFPFYPHTLPPFGSGPSSYHQLRQKHETPKPKLSPIKFLNRLLMLVQENHSLETQIKHFPFKIHDLTNKNIKLSAENEKLTKMKNDAKNIDEVVQGFQEKLKFDRHTGNDDLQNLREEMTLRESFLNFD